MTRSTCRSLLLALAAALTLSAVTASSALASGKPTVETRPATGIGETTATLNGVVNPNGAPTKYHFDYGPGLFPTKHTAEVNAGSGTTNVEVSQGVAELAANTVYHFRLVATNANGTTNGAPVGFLTLPKAGLPEFAGASLPLGALISTTKPVELTVSGGTGHITCSTGLTGEGSITGVKTLTASFTLTGCKLIGVGGSVGCNSAGAAAEEIKTESLEHGLVYISKASKEVGLVLNVRASSVLAAATCFTHKVEVKKGPIVPITPLNTSTATHNLSLTVSGRIQTPTQYENETGTKVTFVPLINIPSEAFFEEGGIATVGTTLVTETPIEVKG